MNGGPTLPRLRSATFFLPAILTLAAASAADSVEGITEASFAPRSGPRGPTLFAELSPEQTGIVTENRYADPRMWAERAKELEIGAVGTGVAIGDYDGDGRPDIFVVSKTESCRLFRNLGNWKFADVTDKAGVVDQGEAAGIWKQGASFADVNNDGRLDLYLCRFDAPNLLYVNQGDGTFKEEAAARGLAIKDASVMAAFCDYDRDGSLDVFIQTNQPESVGGELKPQRNYLLRNRGDGTFADVTGPAGVSDRAQGHSVTWWDYDNDGWPDLYVANDFTPPDKLFHNTGYGTFTNTLESTVPHTPFSSMGSDLGDVNNDGLVDLFVADMAATTHQKDQRTMANARGLIAEPAENSTASPYFMRNALYLNTGTSRFLEAACLAGLDATDWTWSVRLEDLDNDGRLDLHVTNGMHREPHNADLMARVASAETVEEKIRIVRASPVLAEQNFAFRNLGDVRFEDASAAWGLNQKGVSFGAALGDLDGDGDLDLVFSNYKKGATILRNDSDTGHRVIFELRGTASNRFGVGATVRIETTAGPQVRVLTLARGVMSSSDPVLHFGLGEETGIKRAEITWPSGRRQVLTGLAADRRYTITEPAGDEESPAAAPAPLPQFNQFSVMTNHAWISRANEADELAQQPLLPLRLGRRGPPLAAGDVDGDGRDDLVVGGTLVDPLRVLLVKAEGRFATGPSLARADDGPILVFDADGDGHNDLLVTRGGATQLERSPPYQRPLQLNDGHAKWREQPDALPALPLSVGAAAAVDFDRDGRIDVFLGARVTPGKYPFAPRSALLVNRGGRFEDLTDSLAPALREVGLVTAALWSDADDDGWPDLFVACEWGRVRYFHNDLGRGFTDLTEKSGFASGGTGWWSALASADFNGDGRPDFVAGNLGLNTTYRADGAHPALLFAGAFAGDGGSQLVEARFEGEKIYPRRSRRTLGGSIPSVLKRFPRNDLFARATLGEILGEDKLAAARRFEATQFASGVFLSQFDGTWRFTPLPRIAQIAPLQGVVAGDFDGDGHADIYAVQNSFAPVAAVGRFDGGISQLLTGDGHGGFIPIPPAQSGLVVPGAAGALVVLDLNEDGRPDFVVNRDRDTTLMFRNDGRAGRHSLAVRLRGAAGNFAAIGARLTLVLSDGSTQTAELQAGAGYYSQSAPVAFFGWPDATPPRELRVRWPDGRQTTHAVPADARTLHLAPEAARK
ncbi:MAG TPA: FG-GAP-like repeat-containing protein [Opitutaceae bacterium]|nr:FG-GAP-like repeat-containing protein [Opitutaceae bacterium]